ncbi:hypothetical protein FACS1894203_3820 [Bacteroidia bacterium]|nr:hypothetical protein FACS1894203_3820 [Bacteroidia bacterium]
MKGENDILSKHIRERLKDFEQPVPDNLWASIEEDLNYSVNISRKRILWQRLSIAASFLLVLALGTLFFLNHEERESILTDNETETIETLERKSDPMLLAEKNDPGTNNPETDNKLKQPAAYFSEQQACHTKKVKPEEVTNTMEGVTETHSQCPSEPEEKKPEKEKSEPIRQNRKSSSFYEDTKTADNNLWHDVSGKKKKNNSISYALVLGNSGNFKNEVQQLNSRGGYDGPQYSPDPYGLSHPLVSTDLTKQELIYNEAKDNASATADYDYDFPISVGFTVRKQFSDAFALETGLVYTYLSSKGTITTTPVITNNTRLNYLGIPVKAVYSFFNNDRFSVYASAGGDGRKIDCR